MTIRVLLADDHRMFVEGMRSLLGRESDIEVVGEAADGREAVRLVTELRPDVVVVDVTMPGLNGVDATRRILEMAPQTRVIALSMHGDRTFVAGMLRAGAEGYLLKEGAPTELIRAIRRGCAGQRYLSPKVTDVVVGGYLEGRNPSGPASALSGREREVLRLLAEGNGTRDIAMLLGIGEKTVETYRRRLTSKLRLNTLADLVKYAIREGLTTLEP